MNVDVAQTRYAVDKIASELRANARRDDAGDQYVTRVDYDALALLVTLASRARSFDLDSDEIATLNDDFSTGNTVQSILDWYAS
jgi:hypothetical protein